MEMFTKLAQLKRAVEQTVNQPSVPGSCSGAGQPSSALLLARDTALLLKHLPSQEFLKHVNEN